MGATRWIKTFPDTLAPWSIKLIYMFILQVPKTHTTERGTVRHKYFFLLILQNPMLADNEFKRHMKS